MIKYLDLKGYRNLGEIAMFSHLYQFIEKKDNAERSNSVIILIHAYDGAKIFKGYVLDKTKTYEQIELAEDELTEIQKITGTLKVVNFDEFIKGTVVEELFNNYTEKQVT